MSKKTGKFLTCNIGRALLGGVFGMGVVLAGVVTVSPVQADTIVSVTQISYDNVGRPQCSAVRMNPGVYGSLPVNACVLGTEGAYGPDRVTRTTYDQAGQVIQIDQAYGTSVQRAYARYIYSANGQKIQEFDAKGNLTAYSYDGFDRLAVLQYPSPTTPGAVNANDYEAWSYDANNNTAWWRRRDGNVIYYSYDNLNRETVRDIPGGSAGDVYTGYDGLGRIASKRFASASGSGVSYIYDGLGRINSSTDMNGRTVGYAYNQASARISVIYPDLNMVGYARDNANRISSIGWNHNWGQFIQEYDSLGRISGQTRPWAHKYFTYDALGRLSSTTNDPSGTAHDITWSYTYNPAGQVRTSSATSTVYDYKELSGTTINKTYDGLNRDTGIASIGGYDARGNLTYEGSGGRTMTYDIENRLLTVTGASVNVKLEYDPEGRLYRYSSDGGSTWTTYLYDGVNLISEYLGTATMPLRRFVHGDGADTPLLWLEGASITDARWYWTNPQGSIIGITDPNGAVTAVYKYDPYGMPKDVNNADSWGGAGRFRYTGQVMLPEAKLYYYKARVYDPQMGRFLQTDPIGSADDLNLYAYVGGDPINGTDPTGTECVNDVEAGTTRCQTDDYDVSFATPEGFENTDPNAKGYHDYDVKARSPQDAAATREWVKNNPVPAPGANPASPEGSPNNAAGAFAPVTSYTTINKVTGNEVVVNVTGPGHPLGNGIVVREVTPNSDGSSTIRNMGEGNGWVQQESTLGGQIRGAIINFGAWGTHTPGETPAQQGARMYKFCTAHPGAC